MDVVKRLIRHEAEPSCGCGQEANKARGGALGSASCLISLLTTSSFNNSRSILAKVL